MEFLKTTTSGVTLDGNADAFAYSEISLCQDMLATGGGTTERSHCEKGIIPFISNSTTITVKSI